MTTRENLKGALFFSDSHPEITGYLVICGVEYEIAGWHASEVRSEITARKRGGADGERCCDDEQRDRAGGQEGRPDATE